MNNPDEIVQSVIDSISNRIHKTIDHAREWVVITSMYTENNKIVDVQYTVFDNIADTVKFHSDSYYIDGKVYKILDN